MSRAGHISAPARSHAGSTSSRSSLRTTTTTQARDFSAPMPSSPLAAGQMPPSPAWSVRDSRHRRASSSVSAMTAADPSSPAAAAMAMTPLSASKSTDRTASRSCSLAGEARAKLRVSQRRGSRATGSLDLSKSVAENEDMGVYTSFESSSRSVSTTNLHGHVPGHQRSASAASPLERAGGAAPFVHPMRQTPGSFTPSYLALGIHNHAQGPPHFEGGDDGDSEAAAPVSPSPQTFSPSSPSYPPSARRYRRPSITVHTSASSTYSASSQTNLRLVHSPAASSHYGDDDDNDNDIDDDDDYSDAGTPPTARSSLDSMFGRRPAPHADTEQARATVQQLRREYAEKQRRKDAKLAAKQAKAQAKRERKLVRQAARESRSSSIVGRAVADADAHDDQSDDDHLPSDRREAVFPSFSEPPPQLPPQHQRLHYYQKGFLLSPPPVSKASVVEREYSPSLRSRQPHQQQPPVKRTIKAASNKWGRLRFEATTVWIHSMRSVGLRTRG